MHPKNDALDYMNRNISDSRVRVSVPAFERMKQLYAFGNTNAQISEILQSEFHDIDFNQMTVTMVKTIIVENQDEFNKARAAMGDKCREEIQQQVAMLFKATRDVECVMVDVYVEKMESALAQLRELDLDELDEEGNYRNTSRIFVLIELIDKIQTKIAKIVGTDALREVEVFRQKEAARREFSTEKLLPPLANGREVPQTNFI